MRLRVRRLDATLPLPAARYEGDAGLDLCAAHDVRIGPGERAIVGTGVAVEIPEGHAGLVVPRSGLAARWGLSMVNTPGIIDSGYRGEIKVVLINHDRTQTIAIARGERVCQLVVVPLARLEVTECHELAPSDRGERGFGSTGR